MHIINTIHYEDRTIRTQGRPTLHVDKNKKMYKEIYRVARWLGCWTNDREIGVPVALAAGGRVATVGQLLFAPWPGFTQPSILSGSVNEYRLRLGRYKAGMCDAAWCAPCT